MKFSRPQFQDAIWRFFQPTDSAYQLQLGDVVLPVAPLSPGLDQTPYLRYAIPVWGWTGVGGTGGEFSYVVASPGPGTVLQIKKCIVGNSSGAAVQATLRMLAAADITAAGLTVGVNFQTNAPADSSLLNRPSFLSFGSHTVRLGTAGMLLTIPATSHVVIDLPDAGVCLHSDDPSGVPGLAAEGNAVNEVLSCAFIGREWPLPV